MTPADLIALCDDAIARWSGGEQLAEHPTIMLEIPLKRPPKGDHANLAGRHGPRGYICVVRPDGEAFRAVGYFPARAVKAFAEAAIKATQP